MSEPVYVRCRDAALYRDPLFLFDQGFVQFVRSPMEGGELVLWNDRTDAAPPPDPAQILRAIFGADGWAGGIFFGAPLERVHPLALKEPARMSVCFFFSLVRRIPRPSHSGGTLRHRSRLTGEAFLDPPSHPRDAYEIEIPR